MHGCKQAWMNHICQLYEIKDGGARGFNFLCTSADLRNFLHLLKKISIKTLKFTVFNRVFMAYRNTTAASAVSCWLTSNHSHR